MRRYDSKYTNFPYLNIDEYFEFPSLEESYEGIVCVGGNLSPGMLVSAYLQGIFPWYSKNEPILWWSPDPRFVLFPEELHIPKSLQKFIKRNEKLLLQDDPNAFTFTTDCAFEQVIQNCSSIDRKDQDGTWILQEMIDAYCDLHELGFAHSYETWQNGKLVGGFYGVEIGKIFFGESMFALVPEASKVAFVRFAKDFENRGGKLIDSQVYTDNISRFGGKNISRQAFLKLENEYLKDERINFTQD